MEMSPKRGERKNRNQREERKTDDCSLSSIDCDLYAPGYPTKEGENNFENNAPMDVCRQSFGLPFSSRPKGHKQLQLCQRGSPMLAACLQRYI